MRLYVDLKFHINKPLLPPFFQTTIFNAIHHKPVQLFLKSVCYLEIASEAGRADASRSFRNQLAFRYLFDEVGFGAVVSHKLAATPAAMC